MSTDLVAAAPTLCERLWVRHAELVNRATAGQSVTQEIAEVQRLIQGVDGLSWPLPPVLSEWRKQALASAEAYFDQMSSEQP